MSCVMGGRSLSTCMGADLRRSQRIGLCTQSLVRVVFEGKVSSHGMLQYYVQRFTSDRIVIAPL